MCRWTLKTLWGQVSGNWRRWTSQSLGQCFCIIKHIINHVMLTKFEELWKIWKKSMFKILKLWSLWPFFIALISKFVFRYVKVFDDFIIDEIDAVVVANRDDVKPELNPDSIVVIDSDDEPQTKAHTEVEFQSAKNNHTLNRSTVHINTKKTTTQRGLKHQRSRKSSSSTSHVEWKMFPSKFQCEVCLTQHESVEKLIFHRRIHLNDIPYHCRICLRGLATKTERDNHEEKCDQRRLECYVCKKTLCHTHIWLDICAFTLNCVHLNATHAKNDSLTSILCPDT